MLAFLIGVVFGVAGSLAWRKFDGWGRVLKLWAKVV